MNKIHIGQAYGNRDELVKFAMAFKEFPPRAIPPSFSAVTIMEKVLDNTKLKKATQGNLQSGKKKNR
jgi:hypothetical protein